MIKFRKITAEDPLYKVVNEQFRIELNQFEAFLKMESKYPKSGKSSSYKRYLIRFLVHLKEMLDESTTQLESIQTLEQIERLITLPHFSEFNQNEGGYYSATLAAFKRYVHTVIEVKSEEQIDQEINNYIQQRPINIKEDQLVKEATKRKDKRNIKDIYTYPRSELEMMKAKVDSNWECEISTSHKTFVNEKLNKPFVEGHHLIPMLAQDQFEYTIDFADNIVTLCPNCHRKIHYGLQENKHEMIQLLYEKRKKSYPKYGIEITLRNLLSFYNVEEK